MEHRIRAEKRRRLRRWIATLAVASLVTAWAPSTQVKAAEAPAVADVVPHQALVRFDPGTPTAIRRAAHVAAGARVVRRVPRTGYVLVESPLPAAAVLGIYRAHPAVAVAEPNHRGTIALSPSDACHSEPCEGARGQWHHLMTNTPFGWDAFPRTTAARSDVTIAVLDTKIDASHPDWINADGSSQLSPGRDFVPADRHDGWARYHGTFVAGLAAAATGNGIDAVGVGYPAEILPLTVVDGQGMTDAATLAEAIAFAHARGADIINLSLGITAPNQAVRDAIRAAAADSLVVAAAGNNTGDAPFYPGSWPEVMSVAGTDANDRPAPCSNHNANVAVSAPADRLIGLQHLPGRLIQAPCGTSAAAPQVSGLAALLLAQDGARTPAAVRALIESTADDLGAPGRDDRFGHGRINVARSLAASPAIATGAGASVVRSGGGTSTITATATAPGGVRGAQVFVGTPDATPVSLRAADGSFGGATERLTGTVDVPASLAAGPHPVWVRARDADGWGPTTVGVLGVDGRPPAIWGVHVTDAVRAAGQALRVSFAIGDDYASTFAHAIEVRSTATNAVVHTATRFDTGGGTQVYEWLPGLNVPAGHYRIKIAVADEAGNVGMKEAGALLT